jgi:hypothetical protein
MICRPCRTSWIPSSLAALVALALGASTSFACSQCMCGTPFPADVLGGTVPMQLRFGLEDRYLSKTNALDEGPGEESEREHRVSGFALWRPTTRAALLARVPYSMKELNERPEGEPEGRRTVHGLGDLEAEALIQLAQTTAPREAWWAMVVGGSAPTGSNERRDATGERLDAHLQPGAGAWTATGGFHAAMRSVAGVIDASVLDRWSAESRHGYRYGNVLLFNAGWTTRELHGWQLIAQANGRAAARDRFEDGTTGENTGGTVVYLTPGARWVGPSGLAVEGGVQIPVVEELHGIQDEHATGRLALSLGR